MAESEILEYYSVLRTNRIAGDRIPHWAWRSDTEMIGGRHGSTRARRSTEAPPSCHPTRRALDGHLFFRRAKLVARAEDYPWSSARHHVQGRTDPLVRASPIRGLVRDWKRFVRGQQDTGEGEAIERHSRTGRPWGTEAWVSRLENRLGRVLIPRRGGWPKGRPRKS